eukprot:145172-Amphidinium_carterae.1
MAAFLCLDIRLLRLASACAWSLANTDPHVAMRPKAPRLGTSNQGSRNIKVSLPNEQHHPNG